MHAHEGVGGNRLLLFRRAVSDSVFCLKNEYTKRLEILHEEPLNHLGRELTPAERNDQATYIDFDESRLHNKVVIALRIDGCYDGLDEGVI